MDFGKAALSSIPKIQALNGEQYRLYDVDVNEAIAIQSQARLNIPTYTAGVAQIETATVTGTITANPGGNATITVTSNVVTGSPLVISVPVLLGDDANAIATKIRASLNSTAAITNSFAVSGTTNNIVLTALVKAENDVTLNIAIATGSATGLTAAPTSTNTLTGSKDEIVHPSILFFPLGWNGYKYWMGYTCFDNGNSSFENPCLAVSNDNITWIAPPGLTNPVEPQPQSPNYYADINLFMSPDEKTMYMVFKLAETSLKTTYLRSSTDGVNWTAKVVLFSNTYEDVSPAVVWDGAQYKMWTVNHENHPYSLYLRTAPTAQGPWSAPTLCTVTLPTGIEMWHMDIRKLGNQYHMIMFTTTSIPSPLWFGSSNDGLVWTFGRQPVFKRSMINLNYTDYYKASMFPMMTPEGLKYGLWYGTQAPYYIFYTELTFDRSKLTKEANNNVLQASLPLSPWVLGDTFNRADTTSGLGVATSGQTWSSVLGNVMGISSNQAYVPVSTDSRSIINIGVSDFYCECVMAAVVTSAYILFRYVDSNNFWRVGVANLNFFGGKGYILQKCISGTTTAIANFGVFVAGDRLAVECVGNVITVYLNGKAVYTTTDATNNTGTNVGLNTANTSTRYDNFIARGLYA